MSQQTASVPIPTAQELVTARQQRARRFNLESIVAMAFLVFFTIYFLIPYFWLIVSSTKDAGDLFGTFGFWFAPNFNLWGNLQQLFTYQDGVFLRWLLNTLLYAGVGAVVGTWLSSMAGYALAKYVFRGRNLLFSLVLGAILVPTTALVLPLYLMFSKVGLTNTYWAVLLPSIVSPFGVYLSRIYAAAGVPDELLEAARVDGAQRQRLEAEHLAELALLGSTDGDVQHEVLDADAVGAGLIVAGLIRDDHPRQERLRVRRLRDSLRAFMHRKIAADPVAGTVVVIEPLLPERAARESVELGAGGAVRETRGRQRDVALEDAGETVAHLARRPADRDRAGHIGRAVGVLPARIDEGQSSADAGIAGAGDAVMRAGSMRAERRDRRKRHVAQFAGVAAKSLERRGGIDLGQAPARRLAIEPGQEMRERDAVAHMRGARTC